MYVHVGPNRTGVRNIRGQLLDRLRHGDRHGFRTLSGTTVGLPRAEMCP
jgi:hypothetical protein